MNATERKRKLDTLARLEGEAARAWMERLAKSDMSAFDNTGATWIIANAKKMAASAVRTEEGTLGVYGRSVLHAKASLASACPRESAFPGLNGRRKGESFPFTGNEYSQGNRE
jgi:hypothetical protein